MARPPEPVGPPGPSESKGPRRARLTPSQKERFHGYLAEIFEALGLPPDRPGTRRTPERFLAAITDATSGYEGDPKLITTFPTECRGEPDCRIAQVVEGPIPYFSLCEHHALPFFGRAHVGYIAHEDIIGLSKLTRVVRLYARRFTVQERLGQEIVDFLDTTLHAHGVAVYLDGTHMCTQMRGVRELQSSTKTTFWRGSYDQDPGLRREFLSLCGRLALPEP
jgi:GTP cyclohydrolase I